MSEAENVASIEALYGDVMEQGSPGDFDYTPVIPQGIIDLAVGSEWSEQGRDVCKKNMKGEYIWLL